MKVSVSVIFGSIALLCVSGMQERFWAGYITAFTVCISGDIYEKYKNKKSCNTHN